MNYLFTIKPMAFVNSFLSVYHLSPLQWFLVLFAAMIIGMSKAGIGSVSIISVSIWAWIFGGRMSTGMILPMLIFADILAVRYYKRHALWDHLKKLLPWIAAGVLLAVVCGQYINDQLFKRLMAFIILISLFALFWWEKRPMAKVPYHWLFAGSMGLATGFTSMIGNLAGGFSTVYFISMQVLKDNFIGTAAWMFFILNSFKLPFHILVWKTVSVSSVTLNVMMIPAIAVGFYTGVFLVKKLNEQRFRKVILWLTTISSLLILLDL
ncbi:MAG: sulfite exporter TauE/SafE family protein [Saprospiraceae bacterium]|nr:sulfite exporter TauE/SafE family protein [Saprospiraceae bacterium]